MNNRKWKGNEALMQQLVDENGIDFAARYFNVDERVFRKACSNYKISIPPYEQPKAENHPDVIKWIERRTYWLKQPWWIV